MLGNTTLEGVGCLLHASGTVMQIVTVTRASPSPISSARIPPGTGSGGRTGCLDTIPAKASTIQLLWEFWTFRTLCHNMFEVN